MSEKPKLNDQEITQCLLDAYELEVNHICFLPLGADFNTLVYRVTATDKTDYFLKLRSNHFCQTSVLLPYHLNQIGMSHIIPPIATKTEACWSRLNSFKLALYPYITGHNAIETPLSEQQWLQLGKLIKQLHTTNLPKHIKKDLPIETFSSTCCNTLSSFLNRVDDEEFDDDIAAQTALFLKAKSDLILNLIERVLKLRASLQNQSFDYVMCHGDIHGWNLLIDQNHQLYLIDWDTLILAPKERDLMFIGAGIWESGYSARQEASLFYQGYGTTTINQEAINYYRLERVIEDMALYCEHIFLSHENSDARELSFEYLKANFLPNGTIERAGI